MAGRFLTFEYSCNIRKIRALLQDLIMAMDQLTFSQDVYNDDIYKRLIYLILQRFGHFKCPSSGDNCC
jgi:hypothetical protein